MKSSSDSESSRTHHFRDRKVNKSGPSQTAGLARRDFLALTGTAVGSAAALGAPGLLFESAANVESVPMPKLSAPLPDPIHLGYLVWDPGPIGYVVDEYFMSGTATAYSDAPILPKPGGPPPLPPNAPPPKALGVGPYTTRIVVYRPADMKRFSGNVIVEAFHPRGYVECWSVLNRYYSTRGDVAVHLLQPECWRGSAARFYGAESGFSSNRYAPLSVTDDSQLWGMVAQIAALMKSHASPAGSAARRVYITGYSATSGVVTNFAKAFHETMRMPDGKSVYDGYLHINKIFGQKERGVRRAQRYPGDGFRRM